MSNLLLFLQSTIKNTQIPTLIEFKELQIRFF